MDTNELSPELREKMLACETKEQLIELAKEEGIELTKEQIEAISGGLDLISIAIK